MDTPVWDLDFNFTGQQSVRVSCHPGDFGTTAICNIIDDQPLFYIDDSAEEDFILEEELEHNMGLLPADTKFLEKMRAKLASYDKSAKSLSDYTSILPETQFDDAFKSPVKTPLSLKSILDFGQQSAIFKSYLDFTIKHGIAIELNNTIQTSSYNRTNKLIYLNPLLDMVTATGALIKSMRTAWNHKQGILINPLSFQPEEAILINRLFEADLDVTKISYLWDLKLSGNSDVWTMAMNGSDYDLCSAYAMEAMTDFRSIKSGLAARATFEKWFITSRCKSYDRDIIQTMMGGHTDIDIDNQDASRVIAMDVISGLGRRPDAQNYLAPIMMQIMNDAIYGEVRDRSNANFLWFVTFERRMSEMEQELQEDAKQSQESENNVVSLPHSVEKISDGSDSNGVASVFFLDHFRAG